MDKKHTQTTIIIHKQTKRLFLQLPMQLVPITITVVSSNPAYGEVYSIQQYVIKFVSTLRQVGGFLRVLLFPP